MRITKERGLVRIVGALLAAMLAATTLAGCGLRSASTGSSSQGRQDLATSPSVAGSASKSTAGSPGAAESAAAPTPTGTGTGVDAATIPAKERLVVRNKTLRLEVKDVAGAIDSLRAIAKAAKADITDMQVSTAADGPIYRPTPVDGQGTVTSGASSTALNAYLTVRVPATDYERFLDQAQKLGRVLYQSESSDDVTQQHVDMAARLTNMRAEEARLRDFLNAARNVQEMLAVETELNRVRGEIESMSAQLAYLERQAAMATVTIELTEPRAIVRPAGIDWGWGQTFTDAIRAFVNVVEGVIVFTGAVLPLALLALAAFFLIRGLMRRTRRRRSLTRDADRDATDSAANGAEDEDVSAPLPPTEG